MVTWPGDESVPGDEILPDTDPEHDALYMERWERGDLLVEPVGNMTFEEIFPLWTPPAGMKIPLALKDRLPLLHPEAVVTWVP